MPEWNVRGRWWNESKFCHNGSAPRAGWLDFLFSFPSYDLMRSCWNLDPAERPSFAHLLTRLEEELTKNKAVNILHPWSVEQKTVNILYPFGAKRIITNSDPKIYENRLIFMSWSKNCRWMSNCLCCIIGKDETEEKTTHRTLINSWYSNKDQY